MATLYPGRGLAQRSRRTLACLAAASAALALPSAAPAAEVVVSERTGTPGELVVEQGKTTTFALDVSAEGPIACATMPGDATAAIDTAYTVGTDGRISASARSAPLRFYSDGRPSSLPFNCGVTWDSPPFPKPYELVARITTAPDTPGGVYPLRVQAQVTNSGIVLLHGPLRDDTPTEVAVRVVAPLPPPREGVSVNLLPLSGACTFHVGRSAQLLTEPTQVPVGTLVDTTGCRAVLISDRNGRGTEQAGEFYDGAFRVRYSRRELVRGGGQASLPYTELRLRDGDLGCRRSRGGRRASTAATRRRRLWGRVRGRFRTRARYGAATVRGTLFSAETTCRGTNFSVIEGRVSVFDFAVRRAFSVPAGRSYLAAPRGSADNRG